MMSDKGRVTSVEGRGSSKLERALMQQARAQCEEGWPVGDCTTNGEKEARWCWPCRARRALKLPATKGHAERPQ
jgi:hypothetical protein